MNFREKTVIITGASSGIGKSLAFEFASLGANVVLGARNLTALNEISATIGGEKSLAMECDVVNPEDCKMLIEGAVAKFGSVDILICNAGISMRAMFDDTDLSVLHKLMDVNFWGTVNCCKYALPHIQHSRGSIVGVSSVAGLHGLPARTGYSASKYAMTGFLETLRIENLKKGVHVMIAMPGFTASNVRFTALTADGTPQGVSPREEGKMMSSEEVAAIIARGVYKRKRISLMEFQGRATFIIKKFFPRLLDRLFFNHMQKENNSPMN